MFIILKAGWNVSLYFKTLVVLFESLMLSSPNPDSARQIFSSPQYTILSHDVLQNYYTITYQMTATLPQLQITTTWSMQLRAIFEQLTVEVVEKPFVNGFNAPTQIRTDQRKTIHKPTGRNARIVTDGLYPNGIPSTLCSTGSIWQTSVPDLSFSGLPVNWTRQQTDKRSTWSMQCNEQCNLCPSTRMPSTGLDSRQTNAQ